MISSPQTKPLSEALTDWFATETGRMLLSQELDAFDRLTNQIFGFQLLQLGILDNDSPLIATTNVKQHTLISPLPYAGSHNFLA